MTSLPVITLAVVDLLVAGMPDRAREIVELTPTAALDELVRISLFGEDGTSSVGFLDSWVAAGPPLLILVVWSVVAVGLAARSLRWEPRT